MNGFPLKRDTYLNIDKIKETFNKIKSKPIVTFMEKNKTNQNLQHFIGLISFKNSTLKRYADMSDYFQEQVRIDAKRYDEKITPYEYWDINKEKICKNVPENCKDIGKYIRSSISRNTKECTNFCPLIIVKLIKLFRSKYILDFSSGWGDRLIGACICDDIIKKYVGIDPNKRLFNGYKKILKEFVPKSSSYKYEMINDCAEYTIDKLDCEFDLVFTSPPYYNLEQYSNDKTQSINRYPKFKKWYNKFLLKSINLSINKLKKYGTLAININNFENYNIIDKLIKDVNIKFLGIIYFGNHRCKTTIYQPILIWQNT